MQTAAASAQLADEFNRDTFENIVYRGLAAAAQDSAAQDTGVQCGQHNPRFCTRSRRNDDRRRQVIYNAPLGQFERNPVKTPTPTSTTTMDAPQTTTRLTKNQVRSFWAAWGGWTMDGMDSFIYSLVLVPALRELLPRSGIPATTANVGFYGGLLFALFMIGWGTALVWGPVADRFGRVRTMMLGVVCVFIFHAALRFLDWRLESGDFQVFWRGLASAANGPSERRWFPRIGRKSAVRGAAR